MKHMISIDPVAQLSNIGKVEPPKPVQTQQSDSFGRVLARENTQQQAPERQKNIQQDRAKPKENEPLKSRDKDGPKSHEVERPDAQKNETRSEVKETEQPDRAEQDRDTQEKDNQEQQSQDNQAEKDMEAQETAEPTEQGDESKVVTDNVDQILALLEQAGEQSEEMSEDASETLISQVVAKAVKSDQEESQDDEEVIVKYIQRDEFGHIVKEMNVRNDDEQGQANDEHGQANGLSAEEQLVALERRLNEESKAQNQQTQGDEDAESQAPRFGQFLMSELRKETKATGKGEEKSSSAKSTDVNPVLQQLKGDEQAGDEDFTDVAAQDGMSEEDEAAMLKQLEPAQARLLKGETQSMLSGQLSGEEDPDVLQALKFIRRGAEQQLPRSMQPSAKAENIHRAAELMTRTELATGISLRDKVMVMLQTQNGVADIRLDPPELGSMQIKVNLSNDQASVQFTVQNPQAKEVLEQTLPKLKEMLEEQGVNLGESSVHQEEKQAGNEEEAEDSYSGQSDGLFTEETEALEGILDPEYSQMLSPTGIDFYA
ncbi:flagellar hook-length control protein FliK [Algicola sagamiensis]|uniref:flagellar hook-length control protein FliK n=1 Tax=Algicola sagamiensis TaxID=163869 RepID=UPI0003A325DF|nr:flagellar hook-length control protein FliK [Algicola sagamiensis]